MIIGGYGNFGRFMTQALVRNPHVQIIVAGRSIDKANDFINEITHAAHPIQATMLDITVNLDEKLLALKPDIVIHTSGPFQKQGYAVAEACIRHKAHYIDLADGRDFVSGITRLNETARQAGVTIISGASSVPCLTAALVDQYQDRFKILHTVDYAIATAQKTNRGLATTQAVLSYAGKPFTALRNGVMGTIYGWQGLRAHKFQDLGWRLLGNCDIPDLSLFPNRYPDLKTIRFQAGLELSIMHLGLWIMTWLVRWKLVSSLAPASQWLLNIARLFDVLGSDVSGFYMKLTGVDHQDQLKTVCFDLTARDGYGPYIPCMPAILIAQKMIESSAINQGAFPCMDVISLNDYLDGLSRFPITWSVTG